MSKRRAFDVLFCVTVAVLAGLLMSTEVTAQQRVRSTSERRLHPGRGFWENERAARSIQHARDYSRDLYRYSRNPQDVQSDVAQEESEELGRNLSKAKREIARVAEQYEADEEVQSALEVISGHLAAAAKAQEKLHNNCCKDVLECKEMMECCSEITKELDKAAAEHAAFMRKIEQRNLPKTDSDKD